MLLTDYEVNGKRSLDSAKLSVKHLREFFGSERAIDITLDRVRSSLGSGSGKAPRMAASTSVAPLKR